MRKITPNALIDLYHRLLPALGAFLYRFPSRKLIVVGVTGTNGKSTVVNMGHQILREAGFKAASISSIRFKINDRAWPNTLKMTMPGRLKLQRFLKKAIDAGCQYAVLEVTSEGIKQHRHRFIDFDVAVLTNLTPEHIESHGSFKNYRQAKGELFKKLKPKPEKLKTKAKNLKLKKISIVNLDDENAEYFLQFPVDEKWGYSVRSKVQSPRTIAFGELRGRQKSKLQLKRQKLKIIEVQDFQTLPHGLKFLVRDTEFNLNLLGKFNISNALAAICAGLSQGIDLETIKIALEKIKNIPGRMEIVIKEPFKVVVDYAHTPDALQKVYSTLSGNSKSQAPNNKQTPKQPYGESSSTTANVQNSKLICVLGSCGGGRDRWKRPELGRIAAQYCDEIILTNEDPYEENPLQIIKDIESGFSKIQNPKSKIQNHRKILDRRKAIKKALTLVRPGDTIIITGKGSEPWMCVKGGKKIPWDDREIVREEFQNLP